MLTTTELQRAQQLGQTEFRAIADALAPPKPKPPSVDPSPTADAAPTAPSAGDDLPSWPKAAAEQVRAVQQALADLQLLRDKPDGQLGPVTRNAIRDFQRGADLTETGEASKEVYVALRQALVKRDLLANSPLPLPPKQAPDKPEAGPAPAAIDLGKPEPPPPPPTAADIARALPKPEAGSN